jgi:hypothetical protein
MSINLVFLVSIVSIVSFGLPLIVQWLFPSAGLSELQQLKELLNKLILLILSFIQGGTQ